MNDLECLEKQYVLVEFIVQLSQLVSLVVIFSLLFTTFLVVSRSIHLGIVSRKAYFDTTIDRIISGVTGATDNYSRVGGGDFVTFDEGGGGDFYTTQRLHITDSAASAAAASLSL